MTRAVWSWRTWMLWAIAPKRAYDVLGRAIETYDELGHRSSLTQYDELGRTVRVG